MYRSVSIFIFAIYCESLTAVLGQYAVLQTIAILEFSAGKHLDGKLQTFNKVIVHLNFENQLHQFPGSSMVEVYHSFSRVQKR